MGRLQVSFIYLASPYSHPDPTVEHQRYLDVEEAAVRAFVAGFHVFSPIIHWHNAALRHNLPTQAQAYWELDKAFLQASSGLWMLKLAGWEASKGMQMELGEALEWNKIVYWKQDVPTL